MPFPRAAEAGPGDSVLSHPNIHFCGNPATGKTTLAKKVAEKFDYFEYLDLGREGQDRGCIDGRDEALQCDILDYDKLHDALVPSMRQGGKIVDWIHADFWDPIELVQLVVVLTCDNTVLYDRYKARNYNEKKIEQNIDSEIMQEIVSETREYYESSESEDERHAVPLVMTLKGDSEDDMTKNLESIVSWIEQWHANRN